MLKIINRNRRSTVQRSRFINIPKINILVRTNNRLQKAANLKSLEEQANNLMAKKGPSKNHRWKSRHQKMKMSKIMNSQTYPAVEVTQQIQATNQRGRTRAKRRVATRQVNRVQSRILNHSKHQRLQEVWVQNLKL